MTIDPTQTNLQALQTAVQLGWLMSEMYCDLPPTTEKASTKLPDRLPGGSKLSPFELGQVQLKKLLGTISRLGEMLRTPLDDVAAMGDLTREGGTEAHKRVMLKLFTDLRCQLAIADVHVMTGLDLGRMLADTVFLTNFIVPKSDTPLEEPAKSRSVQSQFDHFRLANAYRWLDDLHSWLPLHASDAVKGSLQEWEAWAENYQGIDDADERDGVKRPLHRQGELWRRLLTGEKAPLDLLSSDDYRKAGIGLIKQYLSLALHFLKTWLGITVLVLVALAIGLSAWAFIVGLNSKNLAPTITLLAVGLGSIGVSWKSVTATLGRTVTQLEAPIWKTELTAAVIVASTITP